MSNYTKYVLIVTENSQVTEKLSNIKLDAGLMAKVADFSFVPHGRLVSSVFPTVDGGERNAEFFRHLRLGQQKLSLSILMIFP